MAVNGTQINVFLPEPEHAAFKRWCREHDVPLSLTDAFRELARMAAAGQVEVDRELARRLGGRPPKPRPAARQPRLGGRVPRRPRVLVLDVGDPVPLAADLLAFRAAGRDVLVAREAAEALHATVGPPTTAATTTSSAAAPTASPAWRPDAVVLGRGWAGPWPVPGLVRAALGLGGVPIVRLDGDLAAAVDAATRAATAGVEPDRPAGCPRP